MDWDDDAAIASLEKLTGAMQDPRPLLADVQTVIEKNIETNFQREHEPDGSPWSELAPSTLKRRERAGQGTKKLQASGDGKRSIKVKILGSAELEVAYIDYMASHQKRTQNTPRRKFMPDAEDFTSGKFSDNIRQKIEEYVKTNFS